MLVSSEASPFLLYVHVHVYVYHVHIHFFYPTVLLAVLLSWCSSFSPDGAILCLILVSLSSSGGLSFHILTSSHPHILTSSHPHIPTSPHSPLTPMVIRHPSTKSRGHAKWYVPVQISR